MPPDEEVLIEAVRSFFRAEGADVRAALRAADDGWPLAEMADAPPLQRALERTGEMLERILSAQLPPFFVAGWRQAEQDLGLTEDVRGRDQTDARRWAGKTVPGIRNTTLTGIRADAERVAALAEADDLDRDTALAMLAAALRHRYAGWEGHRSELIAATEGRGAFGRGAALLAAFAALVSQLEKRWFHRNDDRVCADCRTNANAGWLPFASLFPTGVWNQPQHPHCRCNVRYRRA